MIPRKVFTKSWLLDRIWLEGDYEVLNHFVFE